MARDKDDKYSNVRKRAEKQIEIAELQYKQQLLQKRIDLANAGVRAYEAKRMNEAVTHFLSYIRILENWKGVGPGQLLPTHFDVKRDLTELLLISGIYWDLVKLFDRTQSEKKLKDFYHYFDKYVSFSKGLPYQALCAESLRKYLNTDKPVHRSAFKDAHRQLGGERCFVATALHDVSEEATLYRLQRFRDEVLLTTPPGRAFVKIYYAYGPVLARATDCLPDSQRRRMAWVLDRVAKALHDRVLLPQLRK
jgi:hypothetical protein